MDCVMINYTILCTHWSMDGPTYNCPWSSQYTPSPPLLYFISSFVDAPSLSLEHKNDHDGYNPRNKAKWYLELCSPIK